MSDKHLNIPTSLFDLSTLPIHERFAFWKESIACVFEVAVDRHMRQTGEFNSRIWAAMHGDLFLAETESFAQRWERGSQTISRDGMDHFMVQVIEAGALRLDSAGDQDVQVGDLIVFDLSREARTSSSDMKNLSLAIPRNLLAPLLNAPDGHHLRRLSRDAPMTALLREHLLRLRSVSDQISIQESLDLTPATLSLVAACLNAAPEAAAPTLGVSPARGSEIRGYIEDHLGNPGLTVATIAENLSISRSKLYTFFALEGGVNAYLRKRRMKRASALLLSGASRHMPISQIANDCGFSSESAFSRSFRSAFGVSPRDFRSGEAGRSAAPRQSCEIDRRYEIWLRGLTA